MTNSNLEDLYLKSVKLFSQISVAVDLSQLDGVEVGPVSEVWGFSGSGTFEEDRGQPIEAVTSRKMEQSGKFAEICAKKLKSYKKN